MLAIIIAFAAITFLHIVLGELMPKMFALERAEALALFAARPLELFAKVFRWPLWVFNRTRSVLGRLIGLKSSLKHAAVYSETELRQLVDISRESGHLRAEERRLTDADDLLRAFLSAIEPLGPRAHALWIQFPPSFGPNPLARPFVARFSDGETAT